MGFEGIGVWQLLIILLIVVMIFGTKKLKNVGGDLGSAMKSFRSAMREGSDEEEEATKEKSHEPLSNAKSETTAQNQQHTEDKTAERH